MTEHVYPAVFAKNNDGSYTISFPDLPGCVGEGKSLSNALYMAQQELSQWIGFLSIKELRLPAPSDIRKVKVPANGFVNLVSADMRDTHAVRRTVSLPKWMDDAATAAGLNLSKILQDALSLRFGNG